MLIPALAALPFVHPGLAVAALATALIPLIVHLINRRRHVRVKWAAMTFLLAAHNRSLRRVRFEHWLLLCTRMAVVVLLGLAVARPLLVGASLVHLGDAHWHHVLLVDNSLSACVAEDEPRASARADATSELIPAVQAASTVLAGIPSGDAVSIISLAQPAKPVVGHAAFDRRALRAKLESVPATQRSTDLAGGLAAALDVLGDSDAAPENRAVYVISDQAETAWRASDEVASLAGRIAEQAKLVLIPVAERGEANVAVTSLDCLDAVPGRYLPIHMQVGVSNFGDNAVRDLALQVRRDDRIVRRLAVDRLEPGGQALVDFSLVVEQPGTCAVEVRLDAPPGDVLSADNIRQASLEVFDSLGVLVVDGRPGGRQVRR